MLFYKPSERSSLIDSAGFVKKSEPGVRRHFSFTEWGIVLAGLAFSQGASALLLVIIANKVPPLEYGQYLATYGLVSLTLVLPGAGLDTFLLSRSSDDPKCVYLVWKRAFLLRLFLLAAWLIILGIFAVYLPYDTYPPSLVGFVSLGLALDLLTQISYSAMRTLNRHREVARLQIFTALTTIIVVSVWPSGPGQVLKFSVARFCISGAFAVLVLLRIRPTQTAWVSNNSFSPDGLETLGDLIKKLVPFFLADLAVALYLKADLTIVSLFRGAYGASIYGPALNIVNVLFLIPNALYVLALPTLAQKFEIDQEVFLKISKLQLGLQFLTGILMTAALFLVAPFLINLLGMAYTSSLIILRMMSPLMLLKALNFGLAAILTSSNLQLWRTTAQIVSALFNVVANLIVIGPFGIPGVALVYLLSETILLCGYTLPVFLRFFRHYEYPDH